MLPKDLPQDIEILIIVIQDQNRQILGNYLDTYTAKLTILM